MTPEEEKAREILDDWKECCIFGQHRRQLEERIAQGLRDWGKRMELDINKINKFVDLHKEAFDEGERKAFARIEAVAKREKRIIIHNTAFGAWRIGSPTKRNLQGDGLLCKSLQEALEKAEEEG